MKFNKCVLLLAISILTIGSLQIYANGSKIEPSTNVLTNNVGYVMITESITVDKLMLYDKANEIEITIPWYYSADEIKQMRKATYFYNHSNDTLYMLLNGQLINLNEVN
jgi:hypothetical protein